MAIPDVTLVTGCFNMSTYNGKCRDLSEIRERTKEVCSLPVYLVVYGDNDTIGLWREKREEFGLTHLTVFRCIPHSEIWSFQFVDVVKANRDTYWPTRDERTCAESHLICANKFDFVLNVMNDNPFHTKYVGWIDAFLNENASKICEDFTIDYFLEMLQGVSEDKFYLQILNVQDKKFKEMAKKAEYYRSYPWLVCGCLFITPEDPGRAILTRLKEIVVQTTLAGYGHGEEAFYIEILDEFYDKIHRSYGDYGQLVNNFHYPTRNLGYILHVILKRYVSFGYHREALDCANAMLRQIDRGVVVLDAVSHLQILFYKYVSAYYVNPEQALDAHAKIRKMGEIHDAWAAAKGWMEPQLAFASNLTNKHE